MWALIINPYSFSCFYISLKINRSYDKTLKSTYLTAPSKAEIAALNPAVVISDAPSFFPLPSIPSKHESNAGVR